MTTTAQDILNAMFNPDENVCIRVFEDKKKGIFSGQKYDIAAGKFLTLVSKLEEHNRQDRGIFYTVNYGGHEDKLITRINAQYVEMDDRPIDEQMRLIEAFPLKPSFIIQTRKSLHTYWLMDKNAKVEDFRTIQRGLIKHFGGDPSIVNESRVMRLPGFYHCKEDPIMVKCISFHPELRYSQQELAEVLGLDTAGAAGSSEVPEGRTKGLRLAEAGCLFLQHCRDNAATLSESDWYAMITNLAVFEGGRERIHEISSPYPGYCREETDAKISHFLKSGTRPMTCAVIAEKGFKCPRLGTSECPVRAPAARCGVPLDADTLISMVKTLPTDHDLVHDLQTARKFIDDYMFSSDGITAQTVIKYEMREHFNLRLDDTRPLMAHQKELARKSSTVSGEAVTISELPPWYEMKRNGMTFKPGVLAAFLRDSEKVFWSAGEFYRYADGVYRTIQSLDAENIVREKMLVEHTKLSQITDAAGQWRMQIKRDIRELNPNPYAINLRNGIFNVLEDTLFEHTPDYLSTVRLNVNFSREAQCPLFRKFLEESMCGDMSQVDLIQEMLGYFLIPVNSAQKCFVIVGVASAGKSVLLRVLNELLLGRENVSNVSWQSLNERFKTAELFGKLANIFADLPTKNIDDNGVFKALVGEDYLTVEKKNRDPFSFQSTARLLFSCNSIPRNYGDRSEGFYRRLIIIRFSHPVPEDKRDPDLIDKFRKEADGIFLFALEGLRRLMGNGFRFSVTKENEEELQRYREESDSVLSFVKECCETGDGFRASSTELFSAYKAYCEECGLIPYSQRKFVQQVLTAFPSVQKEIDRMAKRRMLKGIRLEEIKAL